MKNLFLSIAFMLIGAFAGISTTVYYYGTAASSAEAGNSAKSGFRNEISKAKSPAPQSPRSPKSADLEVKSKDATRTMKIEN